MTSSFAASLRKLAEDAAEAKRLAEAKVREAEMLAKAEALRIKRQDEAAERKKARDARIQAEREQREIAANAERIRREAAAAKQAEQKRIAAEKLRIEAEERLRREEAERLRLRELRLSELCTDIYGALAVAAWDGQLEVIVDDEAYDFKSDLLPLGISVSRRNKLAKLASNTFVSFFEKVDDFAPHANTPSDRAMAVRLQELGERLRRNGQPKLVSQFSRLSDQIVALAASDCIRVEKGAAKLRNSILTKQEKIAEIESEIRKLRPQLAKEMETVGARSTRLLDVAKKIRDHVDDIGSSYQAHLPLGVRPENLSIETKATALRLAYTTFVHDVDFEAFSVLEIINLMRNANGRAPIETVDSAFHTNRGHLWVEERLKDMRFELESAKESLAEAQRDAKRANESVISATEFHARAQSFQNSCIEFERILGRSLEGVDSSQLSFHGDQYIGPAVACLADLSHLANMDVESAYSELRWLISDAGRDFAGYMDIVLSELAKEGARSVELSFSDRGTENMVEIGKVSLVCKIGSALMALLFSKRGIDVIETPKGTGQTIFRISW